MGMRQWKLNLGIIQKALVFFELNSADNTGMKRALGNSIFGYSGYYSAYTGGDKDGRNYSYRSRAVVVCGKDL